MPCTTPPLPSVPAAGDTFTVVPDCDHTQARCKAYGNFGNYSACDLPLSTSGAGGAD